MLPEERADLAILFDIYGGLLTDKQQNMFDLYYQCDLSLGEIAEENKVSRQAVFDSIKRTENVLEEYERKLGLAAKEKKNQKALLEAIRVLEDMEKDNEFRLAKKVIESLLADH